MNENELQRSINSAMTAQIPSKAWDSTVGIVIAHDGAVHQFGTATLFAVADHFFVVTAGHVIKQASKLKKTLAITSAGSHFVPVVNDWQVTSGGQYGSFDDPFDVAIYRLQADAVERLDGKRFLRFSDIEFDEQSPTAVYTLFGFPGIWATPATDPNTKLKLRPFQLTTYRFGRSTESLDNYQDWLHILLDAQAHQATNDRGDHQPYLDHTGRPAKFPGDLGGISGCSVWRIGDLKNPIESWGSETSRIVGIETSVYHARQAIKVSRWIAVSTLIHETYPELRPAFDIWRTR